MTCLGLDENFNFLVLEVGRQVNGIADFLASPDNRQLKKIICNDNYIDNLKTIIEKNCFARLGDRSGIGKKETDRIHAIHTITVNLERIGDFCVNIAKQVPYLREQTFLHNFDYLTIIDEIRTTLPKVMLTLEKRDLALALRVCRSEHQIDKDYKENFDKIMDQLQAGKNVQNLITALFIFRYLERIGDSLLNIGEALLLSILGEKIKIDQFQALEETLTKSGYRGVLTDMDFYSFLGSRSGCRIRKVGTEREEKYLAPATSSIFKEGDKSKILAEKINIERWTEIFPGLVPKLFSYQETGHSASLLVEFIPSSTFEEIILTAGLKELQGANLSLQATVEEIWQTTLQPGPVKTDYVVQILSRMSTIRQVHPDFYRPVSTIGGSRIISTGELLDKCLLLEEELTAPFTVRIHGDFNVNNIFYNQLKERIHYIDVYRSRDADYVQDVSVFIISNFRQPAFKVQLRDRLNWAIKEMYELAGNFAASQGDRTFEARMALALARSFYTSTRFELNADFAHEMFMRSHFLLEKILAHEGRPWEKFRLPTGVMFY